MTNRLGIEQLTVMGMPPVAMIELVAEAGCVAISGALGPMPAAMFGYPEFDLYPGWSLADDPALQREVKAALRANGVRVALGEGFGVREGRDVRSGAAGLDPMAELGAERINAVSMDPDLARTNDQMAHLAAMVIERGMAFTIEFAPPNTINSLDCALGVIEHIGAGRAQVLIDAMHFFRSGGTIGRLRALDPALIGYAQICDAPRVATDPRGYMLEACTARMAPGTGDLPVAEWIAALPADCVIGIEVPMIERLIATRDPRGHVLEVVAAARALGA